MKFPKEVLVELACCTEGDEHEGLTLIQTKLIDHSRWSLVYEMVVKHDDYFYKTTYSKGATEMQDESPFEYEDDEIECNLCYPVNVQVTEYHESKV